MAVSGWAFNRAADKDNHARADEQYMLEIAEEIRASGVAVDVIILKPCPLPDGKEAKASGAISDYSSDFSITTIEAEQDMITVNMVTLKIN